MFVERWLKLFKKKSSDEERSSCSSDNDDEDATQPVQLLPILEEDDEEGVEVFLPKHMRCTSHILNLVATTDAGKTLNNCPIYKKYYCSAFAKAKEIWNKQSRISKASDVIKDSIGFLL